MFILCFKFTETQRPQPPPYDHRPVETPHRLELHTYPNNQTIKESKFLTQK